MGTHGSAPIQVDSAVRLVAPSSSPSTHGWQRGMTFTSRGGLSACSMLTKCRDALSESAEAGRTAIDPKTERCGYSPMRRLQRKETKGTQETEPVHRPVHHTATC